MEEYFDCNGDAVKAIVEKYKKSELTFETALPYYEKLVKYIAIDMGANWATFGSNIGVISKRNSRSYQIKWMPKLREGYLRPSYRLFCIAYGIKVEVKE